MSASSNSRRIWKPRPAPGQAKKSSRRTLAFLLAGGLLVLAGFTAALLSIISPHRQVYFLPLALGEYGEEYPVRCWVRQDQEALRALPWQEHGTFTVQQRGLIEKELGQLAKRSSADTVVVFLSGYARSRPNGEFCLLPVDARLDQPDSWLPVQDVFAALKGCPASHKLLLIDVMQPLSDLKRGILVDDAAVRLAAVVAEAKTRDERLSILTACAPGQVSLTSEELGQSVFAHYLCRGLAGEADGATGKLPDERITFRELTSYVQGAVDSWAVRHRGLRQSPQLIAADGDFPLVQTQPKEEADTRALPRDYPESLRKGWELRDQWWADLAARRDAATFGQLEGILLRAEQQWRGGVDLKSVEDYLQPRLGKLQKLRQVGVPPPDADEVSSLVAVLARKKEPMPPAVHNALTNDLKGLLTLYVQATVPKPDPALVKQLDADTAAFLKKLTDKPVDLATIVVDEMADGEDRLSPARLDFAGKLLGKAKAPPFSETKLMARLAALAVPEDPSDWPAEGVRLALQGLRAEEQAALYEPRELAWQAGPLREAKGQRQRGLSLLFEQKAAQRQRVPLLLKQARDAFRTIALELDRVRDAQQCHEEATVLLPSYVGYLEVDARQQQAWQQAVEYTCQLRTALAQTPADGNSELTQQIKTMAQLTHELRNGANALPRLREPLTPDALQALIRRRERADITDLRTMKGWLQTPWPTAKERLSLWDAWRAAGAAVDERRPDRPDLPSWDEQVGIVARQRQALRRARWSIELLRLGNHSDLGNLEELLAQADRLPVSVDRFRPLSGALRQAWMRLGRDADGK